MIESYPVFTSRTPHLSLPLLTMPGAKRRALKKLLSPHHEARDSHHQSFPTEHAESEPIAVPTLSASPDVASSTASISAMSISPLPPAATTPQPTELQLVAEMENRQGVIGSGHASQLTSPSSSIPSPRQAPTNGGYTVDDLLNAGTEGGGKGKKKSSRQRFAEREARKKEAMIAASPQVDPNESAKLEREKIEETEVIGKACRDLGVRLHEVSLRSSSVIAFIILIVDAFPVITDRPRRSLHVLSHRGSTLSPRSNQIELLPNHPTCCFYLFTGKP
jgi:hypothetical protein